MMLHRPMLNALILMATSAAFLTSGCAPVAYWTPLEEAQEDVLTSHEDMMVFLTELQAGTGTFTLDTIGFSTEGRSLVLLHFARGGSGEAGARPGGSEAAEEPLKIFMYAQQHGNEPSGKEAAIALARDIATGEFTDFLSSAELYLVPQVNPDGSEARQRGNGEGMDLNRDHLTLSTPEVLALHQVFNRIMPQVTLDVHEYGITSRAWVERGMRKNFGEQIGALSNPNMALALRSYAWVEMIPSMKDALASREVRLQRYLVTDGPEARFRYSTTALNDGRNSMGIYNTLSYLVEGRNGLTVEENLRERARQQLETMKAFIGYAAGHADEIKELVGAQRAALEGVQPGGEVALVMDYVPDPARPTVTVGVTDVETGAEEELVIEDFHPQAEASLSVSRPLGYVVPASLTEVLAVLRRHGVEMTPVTDPTGASMEVYRIEATTPGTMEDKDFLAVDVSVRAEEGMIPVGDVVVRTDQIRSNLIVSLLEPQSQWGLAPLPGFVESLLVPGTDYPIRRITGIRE